MNPLELGKKYSKIAALYEQDLLHSDYGIEPVKRAISFSSMGGSVLDVGCGVGGRIIEELEQYPFSIHGIDVSEGMLARAKDKHPESHFELADITTWKTEERFDLIIAWDSIFHLPFDNQESVVRKLCELLCQGGVLVYSFGNDVGDHTDTWHDDTFYYSSIGINRNMELLIECGLTIKHLEMDQFPDDRHLYVIGQK